MGQFLEFFILLNVNEELGQSVQNKLSLVDENVDLVLKEFLTVFLQLFRHRCAEHHYLLVMRGFDEDLLNIGSHTWVSEDFVALIDHKEFALFEVDDFVSS